MPEISEQDYRRFVALDAIAGRYNGPDGITKKISDLESDLVKERDKKREAEAKVPGDGAVVLTGDDAKAYPALKELGVLGTAEEIKGKLGRLDEAETKLKDRERKDAVAAAVRAQGWPEETVATLMDLRSLDGASFEVKTEKGKDAKGKDVDVQVPYVTLTGDGQKPQKLSGSSAC